MGRAAAEGVAGPLPRRHELLQGGAADLQPLRPHVPAHVPDADCAHSPDDVRCGDVVDDLLCVGVVDDEVAFVVTDHSLTVSLLIPTALPE